MNQSTETSSDLAWIAAGVQHAVLSRTMPALRHELAGSVSVLRMGLAVIRRRLDATDETLDRAALLQRAEALDTSISELSQNLRRLRHWDKPSDETISSHALLAEVWALAHPFLTLRNIEQAPLPFQDPKCPAATPLRPQPLMYMVLASIYHLTEGTSLQASARVRLALEPDCVRVTTDGAALAHCEPEDPQHGLRLQRTPVIDRHALQCLADYLQSPIQFSDDQRSVVLALR